ncbi:hypothetical protein AB1I62_03955 [Enterococcus sp. AN402]|uniref:plasmid mobilization protein n=1 Tax=Enterococcus sp. AN402 TaxID=3151386 RepID=UPI0034596059
MSQRNKYLNIRVSEKEKMILQQKAKKACVGVSKFVRATCVYSDDSQIKMIDVEPLRRFIWELTKQGTNLNQFMKFINTYKEKGFNPTEAEIVLKQTRLLLEQARKLLFNLQKELEKNHIDFVEEVFL